MASPSITVPSSGIMLPERTTISSPGWTFVSGSSTSVPWLRTQTLSTFSAMLRARSSRLFLRVHSSSREPRFSRNMTEPAVLKSPRSTETPMLSASSTSTSSLRWNRHLAPFHTKAMERQMV